MKAEGATDEALKAKLESRFQHTPSYSRLKWFGCGIMYIPRWMGAEYKTMMHVFLGIARGLGSSNLLRMVKAYLDVHQMSYYESHIDRERGVGSMALFNYSNMPLTNFGDDGTQQYIGQHKTMTVYYQTSPDASLLRLRS